MLLSGEASFRIMSATNAKNKIKKKLSASGKATFLLYILRIVLFYWISWSEYDAGLFLSLSLPLASSHLPLPAELEWEYRVRVFYWGACGVSIYFIVYFEIYSLYSNYKVRVNSVSYLNCILYIYTEIIGRFVNIKKKKIILLEPN